MMRHIVWGLLGCLAFAGAAQAQTAMDALGKHNSKQPIDISADSLQVMQNQQKAIFTGKVVAHQGEIHLKSDRMTVYYHTGAKNAAGGSMGAVSRLDVEGNVVITTPKETARGEHGVYNVDKKLITLTDNVVLTRDKNVLKGASLVYDLNAGNSTLTGGSPGQAGGQGGRVRGLFVPEEGARGSNADGGKKRAD